MVWCLLWSVVEIDWLLVALLFRGEKGGLRIPIPVLLLTRATVMFLTSFEESHSDS